MNLEHHYILSDDGQKPLACHDLYTWGEWFENNMEKRIVARSRVGQWAISTVFLALDHSFGGDHPLIWETMVFKLKGGDIESWMDRCGGNREQALAMHQSMVERMEALHMLEET